MEAGGELMVASNLTPIKKVTTKIACAAGGRGDPCTQ
jgi:hypothetical protein